MDINLELVIHNLLSIMSALLFAGIGFFTFLNNPRKVANRAMMLTVLSASVFFTSHMLGVSVANPNLSRTILMFNLVIFFIGAFNVHAVLALLGREHEKRRTIIFLYASATIFSLIFIIYPDLFLLPSVRKMYFPNYYNPGILNWTRIAFLYGICVVYMIYLLVQAFRNAKTPLERNQYKYFAISTIATYGVGFIPNLLVYNIQVDPLWGMLAGLIFAVPFMYGAVQYGLFNIEIIAKQAFWYSAAVAGVGGLIALLNYSGGWISGFFPGFSVWATALVSAVLVVTTSVFVWRHLRESDILKYEFITTVTHKFRTPLTQIKWASDKLLKAKTLKEVLGWTDYIQIADAKLVDLTNLLVQASGIEDNYIKNQKACADVGVLTNEILASFAHHINKKNLSVTNNIQPGICASIDAFHLKFIIQVFIENAVTYTPAGGMISISLSGNEKNVNFSIQDSGIGMTGDEMKFLFSKFYRGSEARLVDTEGMGIGLFMARAIIARFGGKIWAETLGPGKGSTFSFSLPATKNAQDDI